MTQVGHQIPTGKVIDRRTQGDDQHIGVGDPAHGFYQPIISAVHLEHIEEQIDQQEHTQVVGHIDNGCDLLGIMHHTVDKMGKIKYDQIQDKDI